MPEPTPSPSPKPVTIEDVRGAISSLVILCARLEQDLRTALKELSQGTAKADPPSPPLIGLGAHLTAWHRLHHARISSDTTLHVTVDRFIALLSHVRMIRNGICHGMQGYSFDPHGRGLPTELFIQVHGTDQTMPWSRMSAAIDLLAVAGFTLARLNDAALHPDLPGTADMLDDVNHTLDRIAANLLA